MPFHIAEPEPQFEVAITETNHGVILMINGIVVGKFVGNNTLLLAGKTLRKLGVHVHEEFA